MNGAPVWRRLGIEPTKDERAIRAAYAERLKLTNPEDDPEGFKRLRSAYERAMQEARWDSYESDEPFEEDEYSDDGDASAPAPHIAPASEDATTARGGEFAATAPTGRALDSDIQEHQRACRALELALLNGDSPWAITAAYGALMKGPAMARVDVHVGTERWLAHLLHRARPHSAVVIDAAIRDFGWSGATNKLQGGVGAGVLWLKDAIANEKTANAFLARVRDKRHEFNTALRETTTPPQQRSWFAKAWSLRRLTLVHRFLSYIDDKVPYVEEELNYEAADWWRRRIQRWLTPMRWLSIVARTLAVVGLIAAVIIFNPSLFEAQAPLTPQREAREQCQRTTNIPRATNSGSSNSGLNDMLAESCERALELMPDSVEMLRNHGVNLLKAERWGDAAAAFDAVLNKSPHDARALYGRGLARVRDGSAIAMYDMAQALALDGEVESFFEERRIDTPWVDRAAAAPLFPARPNPTHDQPPSGLSPGGENTFDEAYAYLGQVEPFEGGEAVLECLAMVFGRLSECLVVSETPAYGGRADIALRVAQNATVMPAQLAGEPVDRVPIRFPVRFRIEGEPLPEPYGESGR